MEILRDPLWQFIGATILGLIAILVTIYLFWLQQKRKQITYDLVFNDQLLKVYDGVKDNLEILFKGSKVDGLHLVVIRLSNSGNVPILQSDFTAPVIFSLGPTANIVEAQVIETSPPNLQVNLDVMSPNIAINPILLNPGDFIDIKVLATKCESVNAQCRIVGVKQIQVGGKITDGNALEKTFFIPLIFSGFAICMIIINEFYSEADKMPVEGLLCFSGFIMNSMLGLIVYTLSNSRLKKWQKKL